MSVDQEVDLKRPREGNEDSTETEEEVGGGLEDAGAGAAALSAVPFVQEGGFGGGTSSCSQGRAV
jgi:hypothetical protein